MIKKAIFFLFSALIIFLMVFMYLIFTKNAQLSGDAYYKTFNQHAGDITTITEKKLWRHPDNTRLLAGDKIDANFTANIDNLGIIAIPFNTHNKSINDKVVFRLKEIGKEDWDYQATHYANQIQNNIPFPFGFPLITDSKNKSYTFEIESLLGTASDFLSIDQAKDYFFTKYKFSKEELIRNPFKLVQFFIAKMNEQLLVLTFGEIVTIFLLSISPILIILILIGIRKRSGDINTLFFRLNKRRIVELIRAKSAKTDEREHNNLLFGFLITFSILAFTVLLTGILSYPLTGQRKWIPYLSILIPSIVLSLNFFKKEWLNKGYILVIAGFLSSVIITLILVEYAHYSPIGYGPTPLYGAGFFLLISFCIFTIPLLRYFSFVFIGTSAFLFGINAIVFLNSYGWSGFVWTASVTLVVLYAFLFSLSYRNHHAGWIMVNRLALAVLLIISSLLAFRSDSLALGPSEYHWNYFTGVIQTVRSGGELLWSAPSQYGFLNILLPSFLPWTSRNSFFIFQAVLFFVCVLIMLAVLYKHFKNSKAFIFIGLTSLSLFYFADPLIIGPTFYPSSSAMRFFMIYVLIYAILSDYQGRSFLNGRIKWFITAAYIFGALWSAESFLNCTAIYAVYLVGSAISLSKLKDIRSAFKFLFTNLLMTFMGFIIFNALYIVVTLHPPDWSMYFMFVFNYANGFGEISISPWGIHWAVITLLSGLVFISWRLYSAKKYHQWVAVSVCFITLWVLASYYVGRAVTNNLTGILPLIFYIFMITIIVLKDKKFLAYKILLGAIFLPWVAVGIMGGIGNPQFIESVQKFEYAGNIDIKSFQPDKELGNLLDSLGALSKARIVYYAYPYNNPVISNKKGDYTELVAGLPIPLTLLEEPTSEQKRKIIIGRFVDNVNEPIFFIYQKNDSSIGLASWKKFFKENYSVKKKEIASEKYAIFLVERR